jgi:Tol biopolymer transport system component
LIEPAWSPDGRTLAWMVSLRSGGNLETGVLLLDLEAKIGTLMHTFQPQGGGSPPSLAFSPDGNTITHAASDVSSGQMRSPTVWVLAADGSGGFNLPNCTNPTWSPDSARLACLRLGASGQMEVVLFAAADGQEIPLNFNPPGGILMLQDWLVPLAWE